MKTIRDVDFLRKKTLVRVDFNISVSSDYQINSSNDWRIRAVLPTIKYLLSKKAKIILMSHLETIILKDGYGTQHKTLSLAPIAGYLGELLKKKVDFSHQCIGKLVKKQIERLAPSEVLLLENLRFYPGEKENDLLFARELADLAEIYVNDAFGVCHRRHASIVSLPKYIPTVVGFLIEKELSVLNNLLSQPSRPLTVVIGGAKISTKLPFLRKFLNFADNILIGGALANNLLASQGICVARSLIEKKIVKQLKKISLTSPKLHLPVDVVVSESSKGDKDSRIRPVGKIGSKEMILDIGPDTIVLFKNVLEESRTIIWNGPMGLDQVPKFSLGTQRIVQAIINSSAYKVAGGGDTANYLSRNHLLNKFDHVSTGGGAMLDFLTDGSLPGLEILSEK